MPRHVFTTGFGKTPGTFDTADVVGRWARGGWRSRSGRPPYREVLYRTNRGEWVHGWEYRDGEQGFGLSTVDAAARWFGKQRIEPPDCLIADMERVRAQ